MTSIKKRKGKLFFLGMIAGSLMMNSSCNNSTSEKENNPAQDSVSIHEHMDHSKHMQSLKDSVYNCPMHPEIKSDKMGECPECGMSLEFKKEEEKK